MNESLQWHDHGERGSTIGLKLLRFAALKLGRRVIRPVLYPLSLYFALTSRTTRRVSRDYLHARAAAARRGSATSCGTCSRSRASRSTACSC